jgi:hypothetical protein
MFMILEFPNVMPFWVGVGVGLAGAGAGLGLKAQ